MTEPKPKTSSFFLNTVLPIVGGLAVAGVVISIKVETRREQEAERQRRLEEGYQQVKERMRREDPFAKPQDQINQLTGKGGPAAPGLALAKNFLQLIEAGKFAEAYEMTSVAFRKTWDRAAFEALMLKHPLTTQPDRCATLISAKLSTGTTVSQSVRHGPDDGGLFVNVTAAQHDGWVIEELSLLPEPKTP